MEELIKKLDEYKETGAIGYSAYVDLVTTARTLQTEKVDVKKVK
jgi:hypothetical protein